MNNEKSQVDLKNYWGILGRRKTLIILPLMIVPLVAFAISYFMKPSYVSTVTMLLSDTKVLPTTVERDVSQIGVNYDISLQEKQSSYFNQITSTKYLRRLIAVLDLPVTEDIQKIVTKTKVNYPEISENDLAENILADQLRKKVIVNMRTNNLIEVSFAASNPISAQKLDAALSDIFIEENLATELAGVRSSISFSEEQLAFYKDKLKGAEDKMRDYRQHLLTSSFGQDTSSTNLKEIASAVQALDLEISGQQDQQANLRSELAAADVDVTTLIPPAQVLAERERLLGNVNRLEDLLSNYSWKDTKIFSLNEESRTLINDISTQLKTWTDERFSDQSLIVKSSISDYLSGNISIDYNRAKRASLDRYIGRTQSVRGEDPTTAVTMQRLQSEIDSYKQFYDLFVSHSQNAAINQSAKKVEAEAKYTIIKPASLPLAPDSPNRLRILGIGIILGLALGLGALMIVELLDNSFKKVEDVTEYLNLAVIGTIPRMDLPFSSIGKKRASMFIGIGISCLLVLLIIYLNFKKNG